MTEQSIWLPFPPSVNNCFPTRIVRGRAHRFPSKQYKAWKQEAFLLVRASRLLAWDKPVKIELVLTPRDSRHRDADNYNKPVIDLLVSSCILRGDDSRHVKEVSARWEKPDIKSGVRVFLRLADAEHGLPELNGSERKMLARIAARGLHIVKPKWNPGVTLQSLIAKGYVETLPGLIDNAPQGYRALEANKKIGSVS
jgi:Holliday junction resolvase RusA-like endonuclease